MLWVLLQCALLLCAAAVGSAVGSAVSSTYVLLGLLPSSPLLSLTVEPPKGSLSVEPPKGSLSVEPMAALLVERATHPDGPV